MRFSGFVKGGSEPISERSFKRTWERIGKTIDLHGETPHVLRHTYGKLTYKKMGAYIAAKEGEKSPVLAEFEKVQKLAKVQKNPFLYVKTWFLKRYADDFAAAETENNIITINA